MHRSLLVLYYLFIIFIPYASTVAMAVEISGKVVGVENSKAKVKYDSEYAPNVGDKVKIGYVDEDGDFVRVRGSWEIVDVDSNFAWAENTSNKSGTPKKNHLAKIQSENPSLRSELAKKDKSLNSIVNSTNAGSDSEALEISGKRTIEVTDRKSRIDSLWMGMGKAEIAGNKTIITSDRRSFAAASFVSYPIHDFHSSASIELMKGADPEAWLMCSSFIKGGSGFESILFGKNNEKLIIGRLQGEDRIPLIIKNIRVKTNKVDRFEIIKIGNKYKFIFNGKIVFEWTDPVLKDQDMEGYVAAGVGIDSKAAFTDWKVFKIN